MSELARTDLGKMRRTHSRSSENASENMEVRTLSMVKTVLGESSQNDGGHYSEFAV